MSSLRAKTWFQYALDLQENHLRETQAVPRIFYFPRADGLFLMRAPMKRAAVLSVRTSWKKKEEKRRESFWRRDGEVYVHAVSMSYAMKATSKTRGHAQKRLMANHIRACPWWAFATIAHRLSSGPKSERHKRAPKYTVADDDDDSWRSLMMRDS